MKTYLILNNNIFYEHTDNSPFQNTNKSFYSEFVNALIVYKLSFAKSTQKFHFKSVFGHFLLYADKRGNQKS